ncbi:hypothetical protein G6L46_10250 [Agrobacterium rhizogenes]|uniref:hypothetical protein n=1 Tax=Rhizobium rhizogenes TaxID=359 RepID=UPI00157297BB|nr:hypothetical protein [Rhizobium rhizogenes]NTF87505.1 hypothetical protein [Rhizobium rhizogenes]
MPTVMINGATVDTDDPCALYQALYAVKLKRLAGEQVAETEIRSPVGQRRIQVSSVSMADLDAELNRLADACSQKNGGARRRFAKSIRWSC